jgi:hypothetical protein
MNCNSWKLLPLLLVLFPGNLAGAETHSGSSASLSGVVKGGSDANLTIHLEPAVDNPVRYYDGYEALPKADGSFSFTEIPPGNYRLTVVDANAQVSKAPRPGISVPLNPGGDRVGLRPSAFTVLFPADLPSGAIHLREGEHRKAITLELTHTVSICGHITHDIAPGHEYGGTEGPSNIVPLDASVTYYHVNPEFGILDNGTNVDTEKDGSFRVTDLAPGTYFGKVGSTWYPGTNTFARAKPIVVGSEPSLACTIDIQQLAYNFCWVDGKRQVRGTSLDGRIDSDPASDKNRYRINFLERNPLGISVSIFASGPIIVQPESLTAGQSFHASVCAGDYDVVLNQQDQRSGNVWGDAPVQKIIFDVKKVTVSEDGTSPVDFTPHSMATIAGDVHLEGITREEFCPYCQAIYVSILREGNGEFQTATLSPGNHFDFHNVTPGDYQLFVYTTRPDKVFLKSIVAGGQSTQGRRFSIPDAKFVPLVVTLSGDLAQAAGHLSPDARHATHWETEGMRPRGSVSGKVIGEEGAVYTVRLLPLVFNNSQAQFTTKTGADGSFHFEDVPPGAYLLRAHDKDYVRMDYGAKAPEQRGTPLLVAAGARMGDLTLRAPHRNSICGHVTNANGELQRGLRIAYQNAAKPTQSQTPDISSDNEGYFRVDGLVAGDYFLAGIRAAAGDFLIGLSADGQLSGFKPVHVVDGKDVGCGGASPLELHVPASTDHYSVFGALTGELPARLGDRFEVELDAAQDMTPFWPQNRRADLGDDHRFHFDNLPSGQYRIRVYGLYGKKPSSGGYFLGPYIEPLRHLVASRIVTIADHDVADLALAALTLPEVTGTVAIPKLAGQWSTLKPDDLTIALVPHRRNGVSTAVLKDQGNGQAGFDMGAVDPGEYEVRIQSTRGYFVNSALYIQAVKLNGKEVDPLLIQVAETGAVNLQVELGNKMASVRAHVSEEKAFPAPRVPLAEWCSRGGNYQVLLLPASVLSLSGDDQPQQSPRFEIGWSLGNLCEGVQSWAAKVYNRDMPNLPPGRYYALALQSGTQINMGVQGQGDFSVTQRALWKELAKIATPVTLNPDEHLELNLDDKTIEAARILGQLAVPDEQENLRSTNGQACCSR